MKTARRLDIIEDYFSSKLREVRQLALENRLSIWELEAQTCGHHNPLLML
jgi:hypothetical protein